MLIIYGSSLLRDRVGRITKIVIVPEHSWPLFLSLGELLLMLVRRHLVFSHIVVFTPSIAREVGVLERRSAFLTQQGTYLLSCYTTLLYWYIPPFSQVFSFIHAFFLSVCPDQDVAGWRCNPGSMHSKKEVVIPINLHSLTCGKKISAFLPIWSCV